MNIKYETRNAQVKSQKSKFSRLLVAMRNYVGFLLGVLSYLIYLVEYQNKIGFTGMWDTILVILPISLLIIVFFLDKNIDNVPKQKNVWINNWEQLKEKNSVN